MPGLSKHLVQESNVGTVSVCGSNILGYFLYLYGAYSFVQGVKVMLKTFAFYDPVIYTMRYFDNVIVTSKPLVMPAIWVAPKWQTM